jgi:hypothetical protein
VNTVKWRMSRWQVLLLVFTLGVCVSPFDAATIFVPVLGARGTWWGVVPMLAGGLLGILVVSTLVRRFHGIPLDQAVQGILGPVVGFAYLAVLALLLLTAAPVNLAVFVSTAHAVMLPRLPHAYGAVMVGLTGVYAAACGPEAIGRCVSVLAPAMLVGLAAVFLPLPLESHLGFLLPVQVPTRTEWLSPPVLAGAGLVRGFLPLLVLGPFTRQPVATGRAVLLNTLAWLLVAAAVVLPVAIFDAPLDHQMSLPFLSAEETLYWRWLPIRNLAPVTLLLWYMVSFITFATYLWMGTWLVRRLFPALPDQWTTVVLGIGGVAAGSLDVAKPSVHTALVFWNLAVVVLGVLVPAALCLLSRGKQAGDMRAPREAQKQAGTESAPAG